jgi:hypothetical protein
MFSLRSTAKLLESEAEHGGKSSPAESMHRSQAEPFLQELLGDQAIHGTTSGVSDTFHAAGSSPGRIGTPVT